MQISIDIAGFTPAEADQLRRSLGKQRSAASVDAMGKKLYESLTQKGIPRQFADDLFQYIKGYAHYGFPESHAASYASLAYKSAYMKCHHPAELLIGLINSQPMGFYPIDTLINEARRNGVQVLPIDPNISEWDATLEAPKTVRMGFRNIKRINEEDVLQMIQERKRKPFTSIEDFIARTQFSKEVFENLALADVFRSFGFDRRHSFWKSLEFQSLCETQKNLHEKDGQRRKPSQLSLFDEKTQLDSADDLFSQMSLLEEISLDYRKTGYSLTGHMMKAIRLEQPWLPPLSSVQVKRLAKGKIIQFAGVMTVLQRPPPANGTAFMTLEDDHGSLDTVIRPDVYEKFHSVFRNSRFLIIEGKVQKRGHGTTVLVSRIESFAKNPSEKPMVHGAHPRSLGRPDWGPR